MPKSPVLLDLNSRGAGVKKVHTSLSALGLSLPQHETDEGRFGVGTRDALRAFQQQHGLPATGTLDEATQAALGQAAAETAQESWRIEGQVYLESGTPGAGLRLRLHARALAGQESRLGEGTTDERGYYAIRYQPALAPVNVEVRALDGAGAEIPLSSVKYDVSKHQVLNLVAPESLRPRAAEYQRLTQDLGRHLGRTKLAHAREDLEQRDLTILSRLSGWDARLIALAAAAQRLSAETGLAPEALYALFRTGLPTDKAELAQLHPEVVSRALSRAQAAGLVSLPERAVTQAMTAFSRLAREVRRAAKAPGTPSSFDELLRQTGLDDRERELFEEIFFAHRGTAAELWQGAGQAGIAAASIDRLKSHGKLAHLTHNNAPLMARLQETLGPAADPAALVEQDLHRAVGWKALLEGMAADPAALAALVPPAFAAETPETRLELYAADLARRVRLAFPTRVVARLVQKGELCLGRNGDEIRSDVAAFLSNVEPLGFALGRTPVAVFLRDRAVRDGAFEGIAPDKVLATTRAVKRLQRLYQITPSDEALGALAELGFDSAHEIASIPAAMFLERFGDRFASRLEAELTYRKAQQVSAVVYSFFAAAQQLVRGPAVHALSAPRDRHREALQTLADRYPTMESLFGSLDFCECEHCRSVLSPAAYLVDLLQFLDPPQAAWESTLAHWKETHGGESYTDRYQKPIDLLLSRRPDLAHLPLTCENTNTALPTIDVVNEILEYYVVHEELGAGSARDTGSASSAELLAAPQYVLPAAYDKLRDPRTVYPLGLPFDLWIESVRSFCDYFEMPFDELLETLRTEGELFVSPGYGRAAVLLEGLRLAPAEQAIFFDPERHAAWSELYGLEPDQTQELRSAQTLARRLAVSYQELAELVRTGFVNPQIGGLILLGKLGVDARDAFRYRDLAGRQQRTTDEQRFVEAFEARLAELTAAFADSGFDARQWLCGALQRGELDRVVILVDPEGGCSFAATRLRYANGGEVEDLVFLKINLLVRLWRKLGWSIEETDRALQTFLPRDSLPLTMQNLGLALQTALVYLAHLKTLDEQLAPGKQSRIKLTTLWSDLPTTGKDPLYAQLFLAPGLLTSAPLFDDPLGRYLSRPGLFIKDHLLALEGALKLTAGDISAIVADGGETLESAPLSLPSVSRLYRHGLLARALELSVPELLTLTKLSGLDPFAALDPAPLSTWEKDHPGRQTLRFVEIARRLEAAGLRVEDLDYLLRHRLDPVGSYRPDPDAPAALVKTLAEGLARIQAEHPRADEADPPTEERLRQELGLLLPGQAVQTFHQMWGIDSVPAEAELRSFYETHPLGFASYEAFARLFDPMPCLPEEATDLERAAKVDEARRSRRFELATAYLPLLHAQLGRELVVQTFAGLLGGEPALVEALLSDRTLLRDPRCPELSLLSSLGPLEQLARAPEEVVQQAGRVRVLLAKALQLAATFGLTDREVRHLLARRAVLGALPAAEGDAVPVIEVFEQVLRLCDYVTLKRELAGDTDDLVGLLESEADVEAGVATLARREASEVHRVAAHLGLAAPLEEEGLLRLWRILQLCERLGVSVDALTRWATPAPDAALARHLKDTLRSGSDVETWRRVSQSIFDSLRRRQRDALVAYVMELLGLNQIEELYGHLLLDPGTEPVVQTSRIRLAISSVQLFIQRCLLNLEPGVPAWVINGKRWQWMKRYRVWEANRKILLFPENWLEPEFRDDKTALFRELEGALLQGDVTRELAEDAFFVYLRQLEEIARLEMVAMYCEERPLDPATHVLHVLGRTGNSPHKYFYRRYANGVWTPWEPVPLEIESDLLALVVWRERLHLFWVTPFEKPEEADDAGTDLAGLLERPPSRLKSRRTVELQLNWSDLYQGQWTRRTSSGFAAPMRLAVQKGFDLSETYLHVSKEHVEGEERGVRVHLRFRRAAPASRPDGLLAAGVVGSVELQEGPGELREREQTLQVGRWDIRAVSECGELIMHAGARGALQSVSTDLAFRVVSKNSPPQIRWGEEPRRQPYLLNGIRSGRGTGSGALQVRYDQEVSRMGGALATTAPVTESILGRGDDFTLLFCANATAHPSEEVAPLVSPFFYQDEESAFLVEPRLSELSLKSWDGWVLRPRPTGSEREKDEWWEKLPLFAAGPGPGPGCAFDSVSLLAVRSREDWLTSPATLLHIGDRLVGADGALDQVSIAAVGSAGVGGLRVVGAGGLNAGAIAQPRRG